MPHFYAIQHVASGELMPVLKNGRGYTHWNPGSPLWYSDCSTNTPRLFTTLKHAKGSVARWAGYRLKVLTSVGILGQRVWADSPDAVVRRSRDLRIVSAQVSISGELYHA